MAINHRRLVTAVKRPLRIAGALYLLVAVLGGVAQLAAGAGLRLPGIARHIDAQPATAQVSLVADVAVAALFATVGTALHLLFRHIDRHAARTTVVYVAVGVGMVLVNLLFQLAALLGEADPFHHALGARPSGGLVARLLDMHDHGYTIAGVFFGLCLLGLGYLAYQSSQIPPVLNTLLTVSWLLDLLLRLLWPDLPAVIHTIIAPPPVADLWLTLYMVAKGVPRRPRSATRTRRGADDGQRRRLPFTGVDSAHIDPAPATTASRRTADGQRVLPAGSVRGDRCDDPSPHTVRRESAEWPRSADDSRGRPSVDVLFTQGLHAQRTAPDHSSGG